jgi:hypothetical protein
MGEEPPGRHGSMALPGARQVISRSRRQILTLESASDQYELWCAILGSSESWVQGPPGAVIVFGSAVKHIATLIEKVLRSRWNLSRS